VLRKYSGLIARFANQKIICGHRKKRKVRIKLKPAWTLFKLVARLNWFRQGGNIHFLKLGNRQTQEEIDLMNHRAPGPSVQLPEPPT
jgi:hypothetical protein